MTEPRAYTPEEVRQKFLDHLYHLTNYWPEHAIDKKDACRSMVFSILCILDGVTMDLPMMNLSLHPHEDDKEFLKGEGENWFEPGQIINEISMHDEWSAFIKAKSTPQ